MILTCILVLTILILLAIIIFAVSVGGAAFIIIFGDVIVCIGLIVMLIRWLHKRRKS